MKKAELLMKKLWLEKRKFVDSMSIKELCEELNTEYSNMIRYLLSRGYLIRVFRGVFYVKSVEEIKLKKIDVSHLELIARGLRIKGVDNWYFGLYTALRLNGLTHEYFDVIFVINDSIFRSKEIRIAGERVKFIKLKKGLFGFGIIKKDAIKFSDPEKTLLDFVYVSRYRSLPEERIGLIVEEYLEKLDPKKVRVYLKFYPKTVENVMRNAGISGSP